MQYLLLSDIKRQVVVEHDEDDALLTMMAEAVEAQMPRVLGRDSLDELTDENGLLPADLYLAMLMKVGDYYAHRESQTSYALHDTGALRSLLLHYVRH